MRCVSLVPAFDQCRRGTVYRSHFIHISLFPYILYECLSRVFVSFGDLCKDMEYITEQTLNPKP